MQANWTPNIVLNQHGWVTPMAGQFGNSRRAANTTNKEKTSPPTWKNLLKETGLDAFVSSNCGGSHPDGAVTPRLSLWEDLIALSEQEFKQSGLPRPSRQLEVVGVRRYAYLQSEAMGRGDITHLERLDSMVVDNKPFYLVEYKPVSNELSRLEYWGMQIRSWLPRLLGRTILEKEKALASFLFEKTPSLKTS